MGVGRKVGVALAALLAAGPLAAANFDDDLYHEVILFYWDTHVLDVLIVPPAAADVLPRLHAIEKSIDAWEDGILQLGAPWLASNLEIHRYTVGVDVPTVAAVADPEIVVLSAEYNPVLLLGIGVSWDYLACQGIDPLLQALSAASAASSPPADGPLAGAARAAPTLPPDWHQHPGSGWAMKVTTCRDATENICFVLNTNFAVNEFGQHRMFDLNAHEFGHCLGIGHTGDAGDFRSTTFPWYDIMSYKFTPDQVHCVSTLNVRSVEGTFARTLGRPPSEWKVYRDYVHMHPNEYDQVDCLNPDGSSTHVRPTSAGSRRTVSESFGGSSVPAGWTLSGLWRVGSDCGGGAGGSSALQYNLASSCQYATGGRTWGRAVAPAVNLTNSTAPTLNFTTRYVKESASGVYDVMRVEVRTPSTHWASLWQRDARSLNEPNPVTVSLSLASFRGEGTQVRFMFDSMDGTGNNFLGWVVDNVVVQ
ncbi:MAG TPA: hypothetical protein VM681_00635 [Candidatus Thermoplasmatota archaeon]|nr:hypothetical protein [Candidatus Thermoplasmatota archaeon]